MFVDPVYFMFNGLLYHGPPSGTFATIIVLLLKTSLMKYKKTFPLEVEYIKKYFNDPHLVNRRIGEWKHLSGI